MSDTNKMISDISSLSKKVNKDIMRLMEVYNMLFNDVNHRFKEEYVRQNGKINGLEDFYSLVITLKGDKTKVANAFGLINRLKDISQFNISEEALEEQQEKINELKDIQEILNQTTDQESLEYSDLPEDTIDEILQQTDNIKE